MVGYEAEENDKSVVMRGKNADFPIAAGKALHGHRWQAPLARDLKVSSHTIFNWVMDRHPMPDRLRRQLAKLLAEREAEIFQLIAAMP